MFWHSCFLTFIVLGLSVSGSGCSSLTANEAATPYRQIRIAGPPALARVDPRSGAIAWLALTCMNPTCQGKGFGGEPYLFADVTSGATVGADGEVAAPPPASVEYEVPLHACPVCGASGEAIAPYDPPDIRVRLMELQTELENARALRSAAEQAGRPSAAPLRPPTEIMKDISNLPRVYLVPE